MTVEKNPRRIYWPGHSPEIKAGCIRRINSKNFFITRILKERKAASVTGMGLFDALS